MEWLVTCSPKVAYSGASSAVSGWKLHALDVSPEARISSLRGHRSLCGLLPRYGWAVDLFIEIECSKCRSKLEERSNAGISVSKE